MTTLRQRLIEDLTLRGYAERTITTYVGVVARLAHFCQAKPDRLTDEQIRTYLLQLNARLAPASVTQALSGLRFFYEDWRYLSRLRVPRISTALDRHILLGEASAIFGESRSVGRWLASSRRHNSLQHQGSRHSW